MAGAGRSGGEPVPVITTVCVRLGAAWAGDCPGEIGMPTAADLSENTERTGLAPDTGLP